MPFSFVVRRFTSNSFGKNFQKKIDIFKKF